MRITEKRFPILKYLKWEKDLSEASKKKLTPEYDMFLVSDTDRKNNLEEKAINCASILYHNWPHYQKLFSKDITVVSKTFAEAALANSKKLLTDETVMTLGEINLSGTLIYGELVICYNITNISFDKVHFELYVWHCGLLVFVISKMGRYLSSISANKQVPTKAEEEDYQQNTLLFVLLIYLFKKYADVEIVDAKPFKKVPIQTDDKKDTLLVDSTLPVKYLDCSWFRTIIRKEGFMVRGHFRLQKYKNEKREWDYKLIYIEPYQKHGYTRTAKKVVEERKENE